MTYSSNSDFEVISSPVIQDGRFIAAPGTPNGYMVSTGTCGFCSSATNYVFHQGRCPQIKAIEYHPDGTIKRIEFHEVQR